mmetsp:Transcript_30700/g.57365  ORF Transcript_30700/g.57365 Transcript_30700/m.57365 type:complete len:309 (-) Transcript_30700:279-1205(-)
MSWTEDSKSNLLVSACRGDGSLALWDAVEGKMMEQIQLISPYVMTCAFSPSARIIASGGFDQTLTLHETPPIGNRKRRPTGNLKNDRRSSLALSATPSGKPAVELAIHDGYISCCTFIDESRVLTASGDATCILWDLNKLTSEVHFVGHKSDVMSVSVMRDSGLFVSGSSDARCNLWDYRQKKALVISFPGHESDVNSVAFFPDGNSFVSASDDSTCRHFDLRTFRQLQLYTRNEITCGIIYVAFSQSGKHIFAGYDNYSCYTWDTAQGIMTQRLNGHSARVSCLGVHPAGYALCSGGWDSVLRIWAS